MDIVSMADKLRQSIIAKQKPDGSIYGEVDFNIWPCAAYLLLLDHLRTRHEKNEDLIKWIIRHQNEDGSWGVIPEKSKGVYENTLMGLAAVESYMERDRVEMARKWVQTFSGNKQLDSYAELFLSIKGKEGKTPSVPIVVSFMPEKLGRLFGKLHMKFPRAFFWSPLFYPSVWTRGVLISFLIISILKNRKKMSYIHKKAIKRAEKKLIELQLGNGSWYGNVLSTLGPIYALHELGYSTNSTPIVKGLLFLDSLIGEKGNLNLFRLTVWETALAVVALVESGILPDDPAMIKAGEFLMKAQTPSGGWAFDPFNQPDNDDTALTILALLQIPIKQKESAIDRGIEFLMKRQNDDGGWSAFDINQSYKNPKRILSNPDFMDPSTPDVTGHVLQALGEVKGLSTSSTIIRKAIRWLIKDQTECGAWWGRWAICYIYGTSRVVQGLRAVGEDLQSDYVLMAIEWMKKIQNPDGGWGEHYNSCYSDTPVLGPSTVEQTSWALLALIDVGIGVDSETIKKGITFLSKCQRENGSFPSAYMASATYPAKYESYAAIFPLLALSKYQKRMGGS